MSCQECCEHDYEDGACRFCDAKEGAPSMSEAIAAKDAEIERLRKALRADGHESLCGLLIGDDNLCRSCRERSDKALESQP